MPDLLRYLNLPMIACECGVAEGFHSHDLLVNGIEKLFMVDLWEHQPKMRGDGNNPQYWHDNNFSQAKRRVKEYYDKVVILRGKSIEMANRVEDESLGLLYIDADHSYNGVMGDLNAWVPKVRIGGVVAGHDYLALEYGVNQAVTEFCSGRYEVITIPEDKKEDAGFYFIIR